MKAAATFDDSVRQVALMTSDATYDLMVKGAARLPTRAQTIDP